MTFLLYGAYGYTGRLIAQEAVERGHRPILAGRDAAQLNDMGRSLDLPVRVVSLQEESRLRSVFDEVAAVLHCAGPFVRTAPPMVRACLETGTHYLDLTGEIEVFRRMADRHEEAASAGVMLLPGIGFDVVPSDCLARHVATQVPSATTLEVALFADGDVSQGTLKTLVEQMGQGGWVRREGRLREVPPGWTSRTVDFGDRDRRVVSIPEGSVVTTGRSTDVPNVTAYLALPRAVRRVLRGSRHVQRLLAWRPLKRLLKQFVELRPDGPSTEDRRQGRTVVWASARRGTEGSVSARLHGPEAYTFTQRTAVNGIERVIDGTAPPGYQTPSTAFGADFVLDVSGAERTPVE
ncbi:MAG: trans-acting enoyl reductase family protein [Salinibacter sp.]|uniref:saccharopine dehydrogenase family protein n=1 Tax=Salinibacter sp. TaxID=2065818 RepID=UPI0035D4542A